jgi:hypothetical protein
MTHKPTTTRTKQPVIAAVRARGAKLWGPTILILGVSLTLALVAMAILLTKFYSADEPRRVFNLNGIEITAS